VEDIRWKAYWLYLFFAFFCLIIWATNDVVSALIVFSIGLTLYIAFLLFWLNKLNLWLKNPILAKIPRGLGVWEDVLSSLYQEQRRNSRQQTQLSATLGRFQHAASALPDGVVVLNAQNEIEWCNHPAELQLGLLLSKDIHKPINYLVRHKEFLNYLQGNDYAEPIKLKSWHNEDILEFQIVNYGTRQRLLICRDVTQLDKIDVMRRDFIANVSHELRTPLTVVGGFLETLQDMEDAIPESTLTYFSMMQDQTLRMKLLIDDLLVLSKIESNAQPPEDDRINMKDLISMLANDAKGLSQGKHSIHIETVDGLDLIGAVREIQSALSNLVSNAIRYSPDGGNITIKWSLNNDKPTFSVTDQGIGIEQQHIERLSERFYRVDRGRSRLTGGTGLGLSIVKHILTRHQANLNISSEIGEGSVFSAVFTNERAVQTDITN
jgi:two-component system phosphate regulon sensor histidine kinase PhoR